VTGTAFETRDFSAQQFEMPAGGQLNCAAGTDVGEVVLTADLGVCDVIGVAPDRLQAQCQHYGLPLPTVRFNTKAVEPSGNEATHFVKNCLLYEVGLVFEQQHGIQSDLIIPATGATSTTASQIEQ
jgi:hypothetical protein